MINKFESKKFNSLQTNIKIENIDEIINIILIESNFSKDGVRSLKNVINDIIGTQILEQIVLGNNKIIIKAKNDEIVVEKQIKNKLATHK